ncbi:hypothetical protein DSO57_1008411 [Entomophthora muscae]|uniref:Uncharacterized protein n=1 Tax=Entomophthora muscae TaxID=34485 RepID=A0ACC2SK49_9FUNG|nr:hypothetical protein DSO57_1008411 [Entomophthora muscae]
MKEIPTTPPPPNTPPAQDFSKLGFIYITVLGLADQVVPHTESWHPLATAVNYLVRIAAIVYMAFQAWPASLVEVQPDSGMGHDNYEEAVNVHPSLGPSTQFPKKIANTTEDNVARPLVALKTKLFTVSISSEEEKPSSLLKATVVKLTPWYLTLCQVPGS